MHKLIEIAVIAFNIFEKNVDRYGDSKDSRIEEEFAELWNAVSGIPRYGGLQSGFLHY